MKRTKGFVLMIVVFNHYNVKFCQRIYNAG